MNVLFNFPPFQPTAYYPRYGYTNKSEVPGKQQALVQENKEKQVQTFTHFNNYLLILGQLTLNTESFGVHCEKILNQINSIYHMAFIVWRGHTALPFRRLPRNLPYL